jgi:hypothetical protein
MYNVNVVWQMMHDTLRNINIQLATKTLVGFIIFNFQKFRLWNF